MAPEPVAAAIGGREIGADAHPRTSVDAVTPYRTSPDPLTKLADALKRWLTTGNAPVKVGALVFLVGLGFLLREANERGIINLTIEVRLIAVAVVGLGLLALGWRLRSRRRTYGLSLQGIGVAGLYLTTYAAYAVYDLLAGAVAGSAVIVITVGAGVLAVRQDSRTLAVLGIIGGFLAPVLAYSQPDDHVIVFSFYVVLSAAIFGVAWFKTWPELNLLGLAFTFGIAAFWLLNRYSEDDWTSVQPFIGVFVLLYMALPPLFAVREAPNIRGAWTAPLVFSTPFMGLGLQYLIGHRGDALAISALVLAMLHVALYGFARRIGAECRPLADAYAGLGVAFIAIAVPLALDTYFIAVAWALQGAVLLRFGCRRSRALPIVGGALLQVLAGVSFAIHLAGTLPYHDGAWPILNRYAAGAAVLALTGLLSGGLLHRWRDRSGIDPTFSGVALAWGICWWLAGGLWEIAYQLPNWQLPASFVFVMLSLTAAAMATERSRWPHLGALGILLLPTLAVVLPLSLALQSHPLGRYGWAAWSVSLPAYYVFLHRRGGVFRGLLPTLHVGGFWVLAVLVGAEVHWQVGRVAAGVWAPVAALGAVLLLVGGTLRGQRLVKWPLGAHWRVYVLTCAGPVLVVLAVVLFVLNLVLDGRPPPLPYLPLLNPLELLTAAVVVVAFAWRRRASTEGDHAFRGLVDARWAPTLAPAGVVVLTMALARTIHYWLDVPWNLGSLARSTTLQASLSILWALIALSGMVVGVRLARRVVWVASASFMAVVVIKLFVVDLANLSAVTRVVSFIGVGILLVIVGYLAPVPPAASTDSMEPDNEETWEAAE